MFYLKYGAWFMGMDDSSIVQDYLEEAYDVLRGPADTPYWEETVAYTGDRMPIPEAGEGCPLDTIVDDPEETVRYETEDMFVVESADLRGHAVREMAVEMDHGVLPSATEKSEYTEKLMDIGVQRCAEEDIPMMILHGNMTSIPDHYHILASSLEPEEQDFDRFQDYAIFSVEDERSDPTLLETRIDTASGNAIFPDDGWLRKTYGE